MRFMIRLLVCLVIVFVVTNCGRTRPLLDTDVVSLRLLPGSLELYKGQVVQLIVEARFADGSLLQVEPSSELTFQPNQPQVIQLLDQNKIQALNTGRIRLMASWRGKQAISRVVVHDALLADLTVEPIGLTLSSGDSAQLSVTGTLSDQTQVNLTQGALGTSYLCEQPAVIGITQDGLVFAMRKGNAAIVVNHADFSQTVQVVVDGGQPGLEKLEMVPASATLVRGQSLPLTLFAHLENGDIVDITQDPQVVYASSNPSVATISSEALVETRMRGQTEISAVYQTLMAASSIQVVPDATLQEIRVNPALAQLTPEGEVQLSVAAHYSDGSQMWVTDLAGYTSSDALVASVTQQGLIVAHQAGLATIRVDYLGLGGVCQVEVADRTLVELWIENPNITLQLGQTEQLAVRGRFDDGSVLALHQAQRGTSYSSSQQELATADADGLVRALSAGQTVINATNAGHTDEVEVMVTGPDLSHLRVEPDTVELRLNQTQQLVVWAHHEDGTSFDRTQQAAFSMASMGVAQVSQTGLVGAVAVGETALLVEYAGMQTNVPVRILPLIASHIEVTPNSILLPVGQTQALGVQAFYPDGSQQDVTELAVFVSSNPDVASVTDQGLVEARRPGQSAISVRFSDLTDTCNVSVPQVELVEFWLAPSQITLQPTQKAQLIAWVRYSDGSLVDVTDQTSFVSGDESVVTVSSTGLIQALAVGQSRIDARFESYADSCQVTVAEQNELVEIRLEPTQINLEIGESGSAAGAGFLF